MRFTPSRVVASLVLVIAAFLVFNFVELYVSNKIATEMSGQLYRAHEIVKVFLDYPDSHGGRYPSFKTSEEIAGSLSPSLEREASKVDVYGHTNMTLADLKESSIKATWNRSLSGAEAINRYSPSPCWVFYLTTPRHRVVIAFSDGKVTLHNPSELAGILAEPGSGR
jgi:Zn-dependent protease with chaperone function